MKLKTIEVTNFGSYESLKFDFTSQGLALIYGPTGSGKSTLQDAPAWILFGVTAKDGNADDIRSWNSPDDPTIGVAEVELADCTTIHVYRVRGKTSQNDLYWTENDPLVPKRGKDLPETQTLLEARLGVSKDLYLSAAYFNEFSPTSQFFSAKAKDRRELLENIADLELPTLLTERTADAKRKSKKDISEISARVNRERGRFEELNRNVESNKRAAGKWEAEKTRKLEEFKTKAKSFEEEKQFIIRDLVGRAVWFETTKSKDLKVLEHKLNLLKAFVNQKETLCGACGAPNKEVLSKLKLLTETEYQLKSLINEKNPYDSQIEVHKTEYNKYEEMIKVQESLVNPFMSQINTNIGDLKASQLKLKDLEKQLLDSQYLYDSLCQLQDITSNLRGELLKKSINHIETETNRYLETYFDAEIRVGLKLEGSDEVEVNISKNGHECDFRQLSKGQRGLLKLCFSVSIMESAANKSGVYFNALLFDEALDGYDTSLKLKAFNLFSDLSTRHQTVLVIEHNEELQTLFNKHYHVTLNSDVSSIEEK